MNIPTTQIQFVVGIVAYIAVMVMAMVKGDLELAAYMAGGLVLAEAGRFSVKRWTTHKPREVAEAEIIRNGQARPNADTINQREGDEHGAEFTP